MASVKHTTGRGIQLEKAVFYRQTGDTTAIPVMFNPESVTVSKSIKWTYKPEPKKNEGKLDFTFADPRTISVKLVFDTSGLKNDDNATDAGDVRLAIDPLYALTLDPAPDDKKIDPPKLYFEWGEGLKFPCVITAFNTTFTKFNTTGVPIRADVDITLMEDLLTSGYGGSGGTAGKGTLKFIDTSTTASNAAGKTSKDQQDKWRKFVDDNPQAFPSGNARQAQPGPAKS